MTLRLEGLQGRRAKADGSKGPAYCIAELLYCWLDVQSTSAVGVGSGLTKEEENVRHGEYMQSGYCII